MISLSKFYTLVKREHNIYILTDDIFSVERVLLATPFVSKGLRESPVKKQTTSIKVALKFIKTPTKLLIRQKKAI